MKLIKKANRLGLELVLITLKMKVVFLVRLKRSYPQRGNYHAM